MIQLPVAQSLCHGDSDEHEALERGNVFDAPRQEEILDHVKDEQRLHAMEGDAVPEFGSRQNPQAGWMIVKTSSRCIRAGLEVRRNYGHSTKHQRRGQLADASSIQVRTPHPSRTT